MKNLLLLFFIAFFFSCQPEEKEESIVSEDNLTLSSPLISLISRVCQNETACDDILDNSSCFSVNLPVAIVLNGQQLVVQSFSDFDDLSAIMDESGMDDDIVHFNFPITIKYANSQEMVVSNAQQLNNLQSACTDNGFHEITCVSFNFPIVINTYNSNVQAANSFTISNDPQLYSFVNGLPENVLISIVYPITVTNFNGNTISISNNTQLEDIITTAINECQIFNPAPTDLSAVLTTGSWYISYYFDHYDETEDFAGYNFTFYADGTFTAIKNIMVENGYWDLNMEGGQERLDLNFNGPTFHEMDCNWKIMEFTNNEIHLHNQNGGGPGGGGPGGCPKDTQDRFESSDNYFLYFTKN